MRRSPAVQQGEQRYNFILMAGDMFVCYDSLIIMMTHLKELLATETNIIQVLLKTILANSPNSFKSYIV